MDLSTFTAKYPKFAAELNKKNKPSWLVKLTKSEQFSEQTLQADWAANTAQSNMDWTTSMGNLQLAETTIPDVEQTSGNTWATLATKTFPNQMLQFIHWQSFKTGQTGDRFLNIISAFLKGNDNGGSTLATVTLSLYAADKTTVLSSGVLLRISNATGTWYDFDFRNQNITLSPNSVYWIQFYGLADFTSGVSASVNLYYQNADVYADGQLDFNTTSNIGDAAFKVTLASLTGNFYQASGYLTTQNFDVGSTPTVDGEWQITNIVPDNGTITYQAWASDSGLFTGEETNLGAIVDGTPIIVLKRYYRVKASFTANTSQDRTPVLQGVIASFTQWLKISNRHSLGYEAVLSKVSGLSSAIDDFNLSTISQVTLTTGFTKSVSNWLATSYPKNKNVEVLLGFDVPGFTEYDYIPYFTGQVDDWNISTGDEVTIILKDAQKEWTAKVPKTWNSTYNDVPYVNMHHCDVILDVLTNKVGVRQSKIDIDSINSVKASIPNWKVNRIITGNPEESKQILEDLRQLMGCYFIPQGNGKIKLKKYDPAETPIAELTADNTFKFEFRGNAKSLYNKIVHYFGWDGSGTDAKNFKQVIWALDSASIANWDEESQKEIKDKWTKQRLVVGTNGNDFMLIQSHTATAATRPIDGASWPPLLVVGTDGNDYRLISSHTAAAGNEPVTGASWATYWVSNGTTGSGVAWEAGKLYLLQSDYWEDNQTTGLGETWVDGTYYELQPETLDIALRTRYAKPCSIIYQVNVDLSLIYLECGDLVTASHPRAPSSDFTGISAAKYQIIQRNLDPAKDAVILTLLEV